jgi:predicted nucleotidyltransferase
VSGDARALLQRAVSALVAANVRFAVVGAGARNAWAPPRASTDLDFGVVADAIEYARVRTELERAGFTCLRETRAEAADTVPAIATFEDTSMLEPPRHVDLLVAGTSFEHEAIARAVERPVAAVDVPVVTREDLIVYKLIAWRSRDRLDIEEVLATARAGGVVLDWPYIRARAAEWGVEDRFREVEEAWTRT